MPNLTECLRGEVQDFLFRMITNNLVILKKELGVGTHVKRQPMVYILVDQLHEEIKEVIVERKIKEACYCKKSRV